MAADAGISTGRRRSAAPPSGFNFAVPTEVTAPRAETLQGPNRMRIDTGRVVRLDQSQQ